MNSRIIVALDGLEQAAMWNLADRLKGLVWGFKVNDAILSDGVKNLEWLTEYGKLFLDPKLYDIPNTVRNQVRRMVEVGADLITVHTSGGLEMLKAAVDVGGDRILGVTMLTSLADDDIFSIYNASRCDMLVRMSDVARKAGCWGVVCAPTDLNFIMPGLNTVVPGFRPNGLVPGDDQKNIGGPAEVKAATLVVVGRPVTQSKNPVEAVMGINDLLGEG